MSSLSSKLAQLNYSKDDPDIVQKMAKQIAKDFGLIGMKVNLSIEPNTTFNDLTIQTQKNISELIDNNISKLAPLLYRVDIDEKNLYRVLEKTNPKHMIDSITKLIMERELKKVLIAIHFSNNLNGIV